MIDEQTIQKLCDLKLLAMADAVRELLATAPGSEMSFEEKLGLVVDSQYLAPFEPHFSSELRDSMSMKYRLMGGPKARAIGEYRVHGECVHQSAIDRLNYAPSAYAPKNLKAAVGGTTALPIVNTTRIASRP